MEVSPTIVLTPSEIAVKTEPAQSFEADSLAMEAHIKQMSLSLQTWQLGGVLWAVY